ncbi:type I restriction endonuclease [Saccharicrinis aurantiacus]|uniref:type I restriction endonuclease n=1 Tax=Saccharicrinis aurantiacus TaxID=1849719 RepID=UPI003CD0CBB0
MLIHLIYFYTPSYNAFIVVDQLKIETKESRISDLVIYTNGFPLLLFELKTATELRIIDIRNRKTMLRTIVQA